MFGGRYLTRWRRGNRLVSGEAGAEGGLLSQPHGVCWSFGGADRATGELLTAWQEGEGEGRHLRFRIPEPIELTVQAAAT